MKLNKNQLRILQLINEGKSLGGGQETADTI
jgi:hypothetical protein